MDKRVEVALTKFYPNGIPVTEIAAALRMAESFAIAVLGTPAPQPPQPPPAPVARARVAAPAKPRRRRAAAQPTTTRRKPGRPPAGTPPLKDEVVQYLRGQGAAKAGEIAKALSATASSVYGALEEIRADRDNEGRFALPAAAAEPVVAALP